MFDLRPNEEKWFSGSGINYSFSEILKDISSSRCQIHVGTDSDPNGKKYTFVTGIALIVPGGGSRYFWTRKYFKPNRFSDLRSRLVLETYHSICVAEHIRHILDIQNLTLHIDVSSNPQHKSQKYHKFLKNYAAGMGYEVKVKPNSWAASSIADRHTKSFGLPKENNC